MSHIVIILQTYERTNYAKRTINGIIDNLEFSGRVSWYVCDDGSQEKHHTELIDLLTRRDQHICGHHNERLGYGAGANKAWRVASQTAPITLWLEDDWELRRPFDITPYVNELGGRGDVGMVRLGHIPQGQTIDIASMGGILYGKIDKKNAYSFSGNPHLKHDRFMLIYGDYPENLAPGNTETTYDYKVRVKKGPIILWPLSIGDGFHFHHIGKVHSYDH